MLTGDLRDKGLQDTAVYTDLKQFIPTIEMRFGQIVPAAANRINLLDNEDLGGGAGSDESRESLAADGIVIVSRSVHYASLEGDVAKLRFFSQLVGPQWNDISPVGKAEARSLFAKHARIVGLDVDEEEHGSCFLA